MCRIVPWRIVLRFFVPVACLLLGVVLYGCDLGPGGHLGPGEECVDHGECMWAGESVGFCNDDTGICSVDCADTGECPGGSECFTAGIGSTDWSYCLAECSDPTGKQEDCPSDQLVCVELDGTDVCLLDPPSIFY
jgi:hypothetical protein